MFVFVFRTHDVVGTARTLRDRGWTLVELGVDGVLVSSVVDGVVEGQGEWDPPGGWQPFRISLESGAELSQ